MLKKKRYNGAKPSNTPALVATALPPLKLAKIGKVCPKTAKKPIAMDEIEVIPKIIGNNIESVPLNISIAKVAVPALTPKIRKVFVVPVFPDPCSRKLMW